MHAFEALLLILVGAVLLSLLARRLNAPFPPFLALGGAAVAFLPWAPNLALDPELVWPCSWPRSCSTPPSTAPPAT